MKRFKANDYGKQVAAWLPIVIFPQTMAPSFRKAFHSQSATSANTSTGHGFPATFGFVIAALIVICGIQFFAVRERRKKVQETEDGELFDGSGKVAGYGTDSKEARVGVNGSHDGSIDEERKG